jgi:hypothetical protein
MTSSFVGKPKTTYRPIGRNTCRAFSVSGSKNEKEYGILKWNVEVPRDHPEQAGGGWVR